MNNVLNYALPYFMDSPGITSLSASMTSIASFITFDASSNMFTIKPTLISHIGTATVSGQIYDPVVSVPFTF